MKNSESSILKLSIDGDTVITDQNSIISHSNLTILSSNQNFQAICEQDKKWWFYKAELQNHVLEKFEEQQFRIASQRR